MRKNDEENTIRKKTWKMLKMDMLEDGHIQLQAKKKLKIQATEFECCYQVQKNIEQKYKASMKNDVKLQ